TTTFQVRAQDSGGTANGGVDTSTQTFTITVRPVNDRPTFTASDPAGPRNNNTAPVTIPNRATFNPGAPNESAQTVLRYLISNVSNPAFFTSGPAVAQNGTLTYDLAPGASGAVTFDVRVQDNGGIANGGIDTSVPQTFTLSFNRQTTVTALTSSGS